MRAILMLLFALCTCLGMAQLDMNPLATQTHPMMLLARPEIKKELKLSGEQNKAIAKIQTDLMKSISGVGKPSDFNAMGGAIKAMQDADVAALAVLDEAQRSRFNQVRIQVMGSAAILDPEVGKLLTLTEEQTSKAKDIQTAHISAVSDQLQHHQDRGLKKRLDKMRDEHDKAMLDLLTDEQRAKFKDMQGPVSKGARDFSIGF